MSHLCELYVDISRSDDIHTNVYNDILQKCNDETFSIPTLIKTLGKELVADADKRRNRATLLLAELLNDIKSPIKDVVMTNLLLNFFSARLNDYPSVLPSLHALLALITKHITACATDASVIASCMTSRGVASESPKFNIQSIISALDTQLPSHVQGLAQSIRYKIFTLLYKLLLFIEEYVTFSADMVDICDMKQSSGKYLLVVVTNCIEGEKDPRCLLLILKIVKLTLVVFPHSVLEVSAGSIPMHNDGDTQVLGKYSGELEEDPRLNRSSTSDDLSGDRLMERVYNITACYFPITFTPPPFTPQNTEIITANMLTNALLECLSCHSSMYKYIIPFIVDQLVTARDGEDSVEEQILALCDC